jgi:hypothetical protein
MSKKRKNIQKNIKKVCPFNGWGKPLAIDDLKWP